jgi:hypothetical protein
MRRPWIPVAAVAVVAALALAFWWGSPARQARAWAAGMEEAVASGDTGGLLDGLDPAYDLAHHWPILASDDVGPLAGAWGQTPEERLRKSLTWWFLRNRTEPPVLRLRPGQITLHEDGRVLLRCAASLVTPGGGPGITPQDDLALTLTRRSWWDPRLRLLAHDVIPLHL